MNELTCTKCNEVISGKNPNDVVINLASHIDNQECKSKTLVRRIQSPLPEKTPDYEKVRKCTECGENPKILTFDWSKNKLLCDSCRGKDSYSQKEERVAQ